MKKKVLLIVTVILLVPAVVHASDEKILADELMGYIDTAELEGIMRESLFYELYGYTDPVTFIYDVVFNPENVGNISLVSAISALIAGETKEIVYLIMQVFAIGVISVFLGSVYGGYLSGEISSAVNLICVMSVATLTGGVFIRSVNECSAAVDSMSNLLGVCVPAMLMLMVASGAVTAASVISPTLTLFCSYAQMMINNILLPAGVIIFVLGIVDCISDTVCLKNFCSTLKKFATVLLGFSFTVISGIISIEGITFASVDSVGKKAVKYAVGSLIPVVGSFLSGSFDTMLGLVSGIKNAVGYLGMLIVVAIVISPAFKLAVVCFVLKLTSAVVSIFADTKVSECIERTSSALGFVLILNTAMAAMSIMLISMLMNIGISVWG